MVEWNFSIGPASCDAMQQRDRLRGVGMRILIADDHPIVASGCRTVLADEPDIIFLEAPDAESAEAERYFELVAGTVRRAFIGAAVYMVARDQFSGLNPQYWYFWIGLLLIAVVTLLPNGILGGLVRLARRMKVTS